MREHTKHKTNSPTTELVFFEKEKPPKWFSIWSFTPRTKIADTDIDADADHHDSNNANGDNDATADDTDELETDVTSFRLRLRFQNLFFFLKRLKSQKSRGRKCLGRENFLWGGSEEGEEERERELRGTRDFPEKQLEPWDGAGLGSRPEGPFP